MSTTDVLSLGDCSHRLRLCHLRLGEDNHGRYGFSVYTGTDPLGQFVDHVDHQSPADRAGLLTGDRVVEVNGVNVETDSHCKASDIFLLTAKPRSGAAE